MHPAVLAFGQSACVIRGMTLLQRIESCLTILYWQSPCVTIKGVKEWDNAIRPCTQSIG